MLTVVYLMCVFVWCRLQIGDTGSVVSSSGTTLEVSDCQIAAGYVLHVADAAGG